MSQLPLQNSLMNYMDNGFYQPDIMQEIETHLPSLRSSDAVYSIPIDTAKAYEHQYNFYGYLMDIGVPAKLFWLVLRLNDMETPEEFNKNREVIYLVRPDIIDGLRSALDSKYV